MVDLLSSQAVWWAPLGPGTSTCAVHRSDENRVGHPSGGGNISAIKNRDTVYTYTTTQLIPNDAP